jgi:hypothetical protein
MIGKPHTGVAVEPRPGKQCGTCQYGQPVPSDLKQLMCCGNPPQALALPAQGPRGEMGIQIQFVFPLVMRTGPGCHLHASKLVTE